MGILLRRYFPVASALGLDDQTFAASFVSLFMQIMGILQISAFLGPSFSPFGVVLNPWKDSSTWTLGKKGKALIEEEEQEEEYSGNGQKQGRGNRRSKRKGKKIKSS